MTDDLTVLSFKCPTFVSVSDEQAFFNWLASFAVEVRGVHDSIEVKLLVDDESLREVIAFYFRYGLPMRELSSLVSAGNEHWFKSQEKYWYANIFGPNRHG